MNDKVEAVEAVTEAGDTVAVPDPLADAVTEYDEEATVVVSAEVFTEIVWVDDASGGLVTPATATLTVSPAVIFFGTVKVTFDPEFVTVGAADTVPLPVEWVESVIT